MRQPTIVVTEIQVSRMIELVEKHSKIYMGLQEASEEFGTSFYILRNLWYKLNLTQRLSNKFLKNSRIKMSRQELENAVAPTPTQVEANFVVANNPVAEATQFINTIISDYERTKRQVERLQEENGRLSSLTAKLEQKFQEAQATSSSVTQDYQELLSIINKARIAHVDDSLDLRLRSRTVGLNLKMERNGNLVTT